MLDSEGSSERTGERRAMATPRVYQVPPGLPFLDALAKAILQGHLPVRGGAAPDPMALSNYTLILPTRRATRAVQEAFLRASGGRALLLPRIMPISEGQEDLNLLMDAAEGAGEAASSDIPPAIGEMERRLTLTRLVMQWAQAMRHTGDAAAGFLSPSAPSPAGTTPAQAAQLAAELSRLMDMIETEGVSYAGFAQLVPDEHSEHWKKTLEFLQIVTGHWPAILESRKLVSPADRRNRVLLAEAHRLASAPPAGPVIVAGVTGSIPATAELMRAVASLPHGAIVLPGLDTALDEESWNTIAYHGGDAAGSPEHPQFGLQKLLKTLGVRRQDVQQLEGMALSKRQQQRLSLLSETMRPALTTGQWAKLAHGSSKNTICDGLTGVSLLEAPTPQDEAEAVSLILREALETPGRTAALVSPDRLLARRVAIRLESWGIRVDDSAGRPFRKTVPGAFLDLVIDAAAKRFAPPQLMALLKHPLTRLGLDPFAVRRAGRALEIAAFRGTYLGDGLAGAEAALERAARNALPGSEERVHPAVRRLFQEDWDGARDLIGRLKEAFAPLEETYRATGTHPLRKFAEAHVAAADAIAQLPAAPADDASGGQAADTASGPLWTGEAGTLARRFFDELFAPGATQPEISAFDYPDLYRSLLAGENVRTRIPVHPRLFIWGPFEARLQQADVMVLGSLNDGTWPEAADPGPWLNRTMRRTLGLPSPEERIGHAAHDFTSFLGADQVVLTRALKSDGVPTVPSRWLMRMTALLNGVGAGSALKADARWLSWARARDSAERVPAAPQPDPRPPLHMRPRRLSVSRIEAWIANPYSIFAREILRLEPLSALGREPDAAERGSVIHAALAEFARQFPTALPGDVKSELLKIAEEEFSDLMAHPRVAAFWLPRFERFAQWFAETEPARRTNVEKVVSETTGKLVLSAPGGPFTLSARADRIDLTAAGLIITDYKTGTPPKAKAVASGLSPQLPLEAAIASGGNFDHVASLPVSALRYIGASGGEPPGLESVVADGDVAKLADAAIGGLSNLIARFDDAETSYAPKRRAGFNYDYDSYAHLARLAEWSADEQDDNDEAEL